MSKNWIVERDWIILYDEIRPLNVALSRITQPARACIKRCKRHTVIIDEEVKNTIK